MSSGARVLDCHPLSLQAAQRDGGSVGIHVLVQNELRVICDGLLGSEDIVGQTEQSGRHRLWLFSWRVACLRKIDPPGIWMRLVNRNYVRRLVNTDIGRVASCSQRSQRGGSERTKAEDEQPGWRQNLLLKLLVRASSRWWSGVDSDDSNLLGAGLFSSLGLLLGSAIGSTPKIGRSCCHRC
ncbi:hypothetical protein MLD38_040457 [Melastoma candidum]|nr:hypothetical protein MLD38_040838 [Melastoma candidum]KAI4298109.1 hypothetical protein MLD38_040457 [Melastoma candidum]